MKSMAREGRLCKLHRRDWPGFLKRVVPDHTWQQVNRHVPPSTDPRVRWSGKQMLLCWIIMGWSVQGQLTERFREGFELLSRMFDRRRRCGGTYQGLTQATQRVGTGVFTDFWGCLRRTIPNRVGTAWTGFGWTVFAVDGSRVDAPRTKRNEKSLGRAGRHKTHPQWWITRLIHLPTRMMWDWCQGPGSSSERAHLREMIPSLPASSLLVADTGFGGFDLLWQLSGAKVMFLIRCGGNTTLLVEDTRQRIERRGECRNVYLWPKNRRRRTPLCLRLIILKRGGKRVYLLTNVLETPRLSRSMAGELYSARWGIEVAFRGLKQTLARRKVLARTPEIGAMELAGNILALALLLLYAALVMGARVIRLSLAHALRAIRRAMERVRHGMHCSTLGEELWEAICDEYTRRSSKRARDWPHKKKEQPPGCPKCRRLRGREKTDVCTALTKHASRLT